VEFLAVNNFGDTRSGGLAGPMGLFIIVLMSIATVLLIRNMNKRLRRLPDSFERPEDAQRDDAVTGDHTELNRPAQSPSPGPAGTDRSPSSSPGAEAQVNDVDPAKGRTKADDR
jgi:hypothetical protein